MLIEVDVDELFFMANLFPKHTGLLFVVWISSKGGAKHDIRVKVAPGPKARPEEMISVALHPTIYVVEGSLPTPDLELVSKWIELNRETLLKYWDEEIDTVDALEKLERI